MKIEDVKKAMKLVKEIEDLKLVISELKDDGVVEIRCGLGVARIPPAFIVERLEEILEEREAELEEM